MNDNGKVRNSIAPVGKRLSVGACISRGMLWVNSPVLGLMVGGCIAALVSVVILKPLGASIAVAAAAIFAIGGWCAAWTWWSWSVPQWRIWALRNVTDWPALKRAAVKVGLTWPDGNVFEKTEIKSDEQRELEQTLRRIRETEG